MNSPQSDDDAVSICRSDRRLKFFAHTNTDSVMDIEPEQKPHRTVTYDFS